MRELLQRRNMKPYDVQHKVDSTRLATPQKRNKHNASLSYIDIPNMPSSRGELGHEPPTQNAISV